MTTATPEKTDGLKALQTAIEEIDKSIQTLGGVFKIQMPVKKYNMYFKKFYSEAFNTIFFFGINYYKNNFFRNSNFTVSYYI